MLSIGKNIFDQTFSRAGRDVARKVSQFSSGSWYVKYVRHWSVAVLGVAALVASVSFIGGRFLGDYITLSIGTTVLNISRVVTSLSITLLAASILGIYYIRKFKTENSLEVNAGRLENSTEELDAVSKKLESLQARFNRVNEELKKSKEDLEFLKDRIVETKRQRDRAVRELMNVNQLLGKKIKRLTTQVSFFKEFAEKFKESVQKVGSENELLVEKMEEMNKQTDELDRFVMDLDENLGEIEVYYKSLRGERVEFSEEVDSLQEEIDKFSKEVAVLKEVQHDFEGNTESLDDGFQKFSKAEEKLKITGKNLERTKEGYKRLEEKFANSLFQLNELVDSFEDRWINEQLVEKIEALFQRLEEWKQNNSSVEFSESIESLSGLLTQCLKRNGF